MKPFYVALRYKSSNVLCCFDFTVGKEKSWQRELRKQSNENRLRAIVSKLTSLEYLLALEWSLMDRRARNRYNHRTINHENIYKRERSVSTFYTGRPGRFQFLFQFVHDNIIRSVLSKSPLVESPASLPPWSSSITPLWLVQYCVFRSLW